MLKLVKFSPELEKIKDPHIHPKSDLFYIANKGDIKNIHLIRVASHKKETIKRIIAKYYPNGHIMISGKRAIENGLIMSPKRLPNMGKFMLGYDLPAYTQTRRETMYYRDLIRDRIKDIVSGKNKPIYPYFLKDPISTQLTHYTYSISENQALFLFIRMLDLKTSPEKIQHLLKNKGPIKPKKNYIYHKNPQVNEVRIKHYKALHGLSYDDHP